MYAGTLLDIAMTHSESLIIKAKKGDRRAFSKLVNLWYKRIYNFAFKYFAEHDLAMEVTQKTFIAMHNKIKDLREVKKYRSWLYKIATNYCHEERRKLHRHHLNISSDSFEKEEKENEEVEFNPDKKYERNELSEILLEALNAINEEQKVIVIMKEYEGLKFTEIAEILEISENTAKSRMYYGLNALKKIFKQRNINKETVSYGL